MNEKTINLAKKLKALADRGIGGEKTNAAEALERYMLKHNLTLEMLEGKEIKEHFLLLTPDEYNWFYQIAASVLGKDDLKVYNYAHKYIDGVKRRKPGYNKHSIECTAAEFAEIEAKFNFYYTEWKKDLELFKSAYIQKKQTVYQTNR